MSAATEPAVNFLLADLRVLGPAERADSGVSPIAQTDSAAVSEDALDHDVYARAITEFVSHPDSKPPLAIAITAPWGSGKTSLMRKIERRLKTVAGSGNLRFRTVWIDA